MSFIVSAIKIIAVVYSVYSSVKQASLARKRQKKAEREAAERADAAKGFTVAVEGEAKAVPIVYGRNMVGGIRVYHNTSSSYTHTNLPTGFQTFENGLNSSVSGRKHEFLTFQQVISFGPINKCISVHIDGDVYAASKFATQGNDEPNDGDDDGVGGIKINVALDGGVPDPVVSANFSDRSTAYFDKLAFGSCIARLNRDDPQFGGVPEAQFFLEGLKVHTILGPAGGRYLSQDRVYSNNPALCLLDYLLNPTYGRGLSLEEVDLDSFYDAYLVCEKVVFSNASVEGRFWRTKAGYHPTHKYTDKGTWNPHINYGLGDAVNCNGQVYQLYSGEPEKPVSKGYYIPDTEYTINDYVNYNGLLYRVIRGTYDNGVVEYYNGGDSGGGYDTDSNNGPGADAGNDAGNASADTGYA